MTHDDTLLSILRLIRSPRVGPITYWQMIQRFKTPQNALKSLPTLARRGGHSGPFQVYSEELAVQEIEHHTQKGARLISHLMPEYPTLLRHLEDAPPLISFRGQESFLETLNHQPVLAIVGTRNASLNALQYTQKLSQTLGEAGWVIVSGLARGIDGCAHTGSLETGTLAVLPGGLDVLYPPEHTTLYEEIPKKGGLIAEMPWGTQPHPQLFARRNRLISGLAWGVVIIEAALRSGSLITARYALEQGRDVFAVPGFPLDPRCQGGNHLIKQGAFLLESAQDIIDHFQSRPCRTTEETHTSYQAVSSYESLEDLSQEREALFQKIGTSPLAVDDLIRHTGLSSGIVLGLLLELELAGRIQRLSFHRVIRTFLQD